MSKTYTFPQLVLLSGTFDITIITSQGSGSTAVSEKYFSVIEPLTKETEVYGGSLRHDAIRFSIDFDKDNYFRDTIFASFADNEGWVDILIQSNSVYQFYGTIDATTITSNRFYIGASTHESIAFDAHWILRRLEKSKVEDLEDLFSTADCVVAQTRAVSGSALTDYAYLFTVSYVITKIFDLLKTLTGLTTVNISFVLSTQYQAISKDCFVSTQTDVLPLSNNAQPSVATFLGAYDNVPFLGFKLLWKYTDGTKTNTLWDEDDTMGEESFYNKDNVYEVLIDIIKSFGFILTIDTITTTQLSVTIKDRIDGVAVVPSQNIESSKSLLTTEYLESITTSPKGNDTSVPDYEFLLKTNFGTSFNYSTALKTEYIESYGTAIARNHLFFLVNTTSGSAVLVNVAFALRDILEGARLNTNWDFSDANGLTGWTTGTGAGGTIAAITSSTDNHTPNVTDSGAVSITLPNDGSSAYLQWDVTSVDYETTVICWVKFPNLTGISGTTGIDFTVSIYDTTPTLLAPENAIAEYTSGWTSSTLNSIGYNEWRMMTFRVRPKKGDIIRYIRLTVVGSLPSATITLRLDDISMYRSHQYFHQMLGRKLQRYYSKPNSKLMNKYNGIVTANCGDNIIDNSDTFYIKKIAKDYQNNVTEIEAINY